ncbi:MAG: protein phosphatase [Rhizorhabdus sp.]|nr:protein phosphatase [Rhizorhabdus sp.]
MKPEGRLDIAVGFASIAGRRPDNQDFGALWFGSEADRARLGIVAAVADGVGGSKGGRMAAETIVRGFIDGYLCQPETIGIAGAATRVIGGLNRWIHQIGRDDPHLAGCATTFTGIVLRGRQATVLHVGDSRAWHFREGHLTQLTEDHVRTHPDQRHVLTRAIGIEPTVRLDRRMQDLAVHDRLLLASDGLHGVLSPAAIAKYLGARGSAQADAEAIVEAAFVAGSRDNITALIIDVVSLPAVDQDAVAAAVQHLPIAPPPKTGDNVDGFVLKTMLSDGRYTRLFVADDTVTGATCVLKFPKPALLSERGARLSFTREALIGARVDHPHVAAVIPIPAERQSRLYMAMPFYPGETLEARIGRAQLPVRTGIEIGARIGRGIAALHRLGIVHRDIKPDNVLLTSDGGCKLIDLGVAGLPRIEEFAENEAPGTPSFMAPELFDGARANDRSDQYALGVTLYRMFSRLYPYGEIEPFSHPRFGRAAPLSRVRPDIPGWLDALILRAIAIDPAARFGDMTEMVIALESGAAHAVRAPGPRPLIERDPVRFWQVVSLLLAVTLIVALATR